MKSNRFIKLLDWYIIKKFLGTYVFAIALIISIAVVFDFNEKMGNTPNGFPHGETWSIGDNPTVSVLLQGSERVCWHMEHAPYINDDYSYTMREDSKMIRVYDSVDTRLTLSDLFSKLRLCYDGR